MITSGPSEDRPARRRRSLLRWIIVLTLVTGGWCVVTNLGPKSLGVADGRLRPCPASPNCVCSCDAEPGHGISPLRFTGSADDALQRLRKVLVAMPRTRIRRDEAAYLHVECRSLIFRFVDDVEFLLDADVGVIHVRSASRLGYSDLGVNRRRVEAIRQAFDASE